MSARPLRTYFCRLQSRNGCTVSVSSAVSELPLISLVACVASIQRAVISKKRGHKEIHSKLAPFLVTRRSRTSALYYRAPMRNAREFGNLCE